MTDNSQREPENSSSDKSEKGGLPNVFFRRMGKVFLILFVIAAGLALWQYLDYKSYISSPDPALQEPRLLDIQPGMNFSRVAELLRSEGVISNRTWFKVMAEVRDLTTKVQAGQYTFRPDMTPLQMLDMITRGDVTTVRLLMPEGLDVYEIAEEVGRLGPWSEERFLELATSEQKSNEYGVPVSTLEGYLFPAVYDLKMSMTEEDIIALMVKRGKREATAARQKKAEKMGFTWHEVLTLASLIQKETSINKEMKTISGVFHNRLDKNMMLQCDPTAVYGDGNFEPPIKKSDLARLSPYNTYLHFGLPPGPICNPGEKAIEAALNPEKHDYLYFVATGEGGHNFAEKLRQHRKNVWEYKKKLRDQKKGS
ncbi:MAG: endolytic transglycosylase MltG [bacterium]